MAVQIPSFLCYIVLFIMMLSNTFWQNVYTKIFWFDYWKFQH